MTKREYLKKVAGHLQCAPAKKREIVRQLDSHIGIALGEGRELSEVLEEMGEPHVLAAEFNENMDAGEKKKGRGRKLALILAAVLLVLSVGAGYLYWLLPKGRYINESEVFDMAAVEGKSHEVIHLFSQGDYEELDALMTDEMREAIAETSFEEIKGYIGDDWGALINIGHAQQTELVQKGEHYALVQVNTSYEKVSVTYTLTFNKEMQLHGFYIK